MRKLTNIVRAESDGRIGLDVFGARSADEDYMVFCTGMLQQEESDYIIERDPVYGDQLRIVFHDGTMAELISNYQVFAY